MIRNTILSAPQGECYPCICFLLIKADSSVLFGQRKADRATDLDALSIPGGHMDEGESKIECLMRETSEELGIEVLNYTKLGSHFDSCEELQLLHYYLVNEWLGEIRALEANALVWQPLAEAKSDIAADNKALNECRAWCRSHC